MGQLSLCYSSSITLIFRMCPNKGRVTIKTYNIIKIQERNNFNFTLDSMVINYFFTLSMAFPQPNILSGNRSSLLIDEYNFKAPSRSLLSPTPVTNNIYPRSRIVFFSQFPRNEKCVWEIIAFTIFKEFNAIYNTLSCF